MFNAGCYRLGGEDVEGNNGDGGREGFQRRGFGRVAEGGDYFVIGIVGVEGQGEAGANSAVGTTGYEDCEGTVRGHNGDNGRGLWTREVEGCSMDQIAMLLS